MDKPDKPADPVTAILDTHYGVVRHLYCNIFQRARNQINDLQDQVLFLKCINKYIRCRSGQYAHLYKMYMSLTEEKVREYYEINRLKINHTRFEWLNYTSLVSVPRISPDSIDGPYILDSLALRRYTYFWGDEYRITSNILSTPFFCLEGVDHLYYETIRWQSNCENIKGVKMSVRGKHIFHDIFYIVDFEIGSGTGRRSIRFLVWLDDVDVQTELYVTNNPEDEECGDDINGRMPVNLLRRLYIACDNNLFVSQLSQPETTNEMLRLLNIFINGLSANFVVSLDGQPPKNTTTAILNITNNATSCNSNDSLVFDSISRFGFNPERTDQIYEIENFSQLNLSHIRTPNFLVFQHEIRVSRQPTVTEMNHKLKDFLYLLSMGMMDNTVYVRMYMQPQLAHTMPHSAKKQLSIVYMQKYRKFDISRQSVDFNATFFDKMYVFSAHNLIATVKSIKYLLREVIPSHPLIPGSVMLVSNEDLWLRLTQNIIYLKRLQSLCFLTNFTLDSDTPFPDVKKFRIASDVNVRDELNRIFTDLGENGINGFETQTVVVYRDIELKRVVVNESLNFHIYYFVHRVDSTAAMDFRQFFEQFMYSSETKLKLNDRLYMIFMHLLNLYNHILL